VLAYLYTDNGDLGIGCIDADYGAGANSGAFVACVIEDPLCAGLHLAEVLDSGGIGYAIPVGFFVAQKVVEGIGARLGFEEEVGGHGKYGMRER